MLGNGSKKEERYQQEKAFEFRHLISFPRYRSSTKPYTTEPGKMTHTQAHITQYKAPDYTARKIGFALFLIRIKDEVKYNNIFDNTFDVHQNYVKYVTPLHIPLTQIKSEFKGWFPYDRGSQIADRIKVCDRLRSYGNYFCDRLRSCNRDRRRSQKIEPCSI